MTFFKLSLLFTSFYEFKHECKFSTSQFSVRIVRINENKTSCLNHILRESRNLFI